MTDRELLAACAKQTKAKYEWQCGCGTVIPAQTKRGLEKLYQHHLATSHPLHAELHHGHPGPLLQQEPLVCRCGHDRDEHWWSGFVCHACGCSLFKAAE